MRVALLNTYDIVGGAARAMYRLHEGLGRIGIDRTLYVASARSNAPDMVVVKPQTTSELAEWHQREEAIRAEEAPYPVLRDRALFHSERAARAVLLAQKLAPADVLNLHWTRGLVDWATFMPSVRPEQALVWTLHDQHPFTGGCHYTGDCQGFMAGCGHCPVLGSHDPDDLSASVLARKTTALSALRAPLHIVTPSNWLAAEARRSRLFAGRPVHVVPNGLDTGLFRPVDPAPVRQRLGIAPGDTVILFIAHVLSDPRKGYELLRLGLGALTDRSDLVLVTVGEGMVDPPAGIRTIAVGPVWEEADIVSFYAMADLVAVPSAQDNYPNTALEALACGTPVIGLPAGGLPDLVGNDERGLLARGLEPIDFARSLAEALSNRDRLGAWGRAGRAFIERECTLERQASRYAALYAEALAEARAAAG